MFHRVDLHVRDLEPAQRLFDALSDTIGHYRRYHEDGYVGYEWRDGGRPRIGFLAGFDDGPSGSMRLAFGVEGRRRVDEAARIAREHCARAIDGPAIHPEYGEDYCAVFFEDPDGNKFEVVAV